MKKDIETNLNPQQEKFCKLYATEKEFFGNGAESYTKAYELDKSKLNWYKSACSSASRLLSNVEVCIRINELLTAGGLNDQFVDKQLQFLLTQHSDFGSKLGAIREYNKLRARIIEKIDHTSGGEPIQGFNYIIPNETNNTANPQATSSLGDSSG